MAELSALDFTGFASRVIGGCSPCLCAGVSASFRCAATVCARSSWGRRVRYLRADASAPLGARAIRRTVRLPQNGRGHGRVRPCTRRAWPGRAAGTDASLPASLEKARSLGTMGQPLADALGCLAPVRSLARRVRSRPVTGMWANARLCVCRIVRLRVTATDTNKPGTNKPDTNDCSASSTIE